MQCCFNDADTALQHGSTRTAIFITYMPHPTLLHAAKHPLLFRLAHIVRIHLPYRSNRAHRCEHNGSVCVRVMRIQGDR